MAEPEANLRARCRIFLNACLSAPSFYSSIEHGQKLRGTQEQRQRAWGRLKAQGVKTGLADVFVWAPGFFLAVELKARKNTTSDAQDAFRDAMLILGHGYAVCRSVEAFGEALAAHGVTMAAAWRIHARCHDAALDGAFVVRKRKPSKPRQPKPTRRQVAAGNRLSLVGVRG